MPISHRDNARLPATPPDIPDKKNKGVGKRVSEKETRKEGV